MSVRLAATSRLLRVAAPRRAAVAGTRQLRAVHTSRPVRASESPFQEQTSPNPAITKYAEATEKLHTYGSYLIQCLPKFIQQFSVFKDELTLYIPPAGVIPVLTFLRDHSQCQFKGCMDISGVDYPERDQRFEVVYHLLSIKYGGRIRVKTYAGETDPVPSAVPVFSGADWYEREVWDLFGLVVRVLKRAIGFEGHPLRKDFPLTGYTEVRYDEEKKRVFMSPCNSRRPSGSSSSFDVSSPLMQMRRNFDALSPWEQVGDGTVPKRPDELKPVPPPPAEEPQKK
ncbi:uncharacterized protein B0H18DRAFT_970609 [Fomitopsis serialis]|uniref:uncharacterized protein n=1 Tax=Fomitopsis serialis TaxID=139415 RepID=UPI002007DB63|nr:uncharacterized protein B0H18DRAFT_970609 [Neoantrodia serialis]KAH9937439.1 hypothetical protein B0H18DRAFT_970609 [Neoantrodia serialis]